MIDYTDGSGKQYHTQLKCGDVGKYVILPGDPQRCKEIAKYFDEYKFIASNREFTTYTGTLSGIKVSVTSTGIGGPSAAIALEELVRCGADTFIRVGTCGGIRSDIIGGDLVIATGAVRMDGTGREYAPIEFPAVADIDIINALRTAAIKIIPASNKVQVGVVQCKDSFFGQHEPESKPVYNELMNKWEAWKRCGCLASEMESSTLFVVGSCLGVKVGTVLHVIANQEREKSELSNITVHDTSYAIRTAVDSLRILMQIK